MQVVDKKENMIEPSGSPNAANEQVGEERSRAQVYRLLATLLSRPPDTQTLQIVRDLSGDETAFGNAINTLAKQAGQTTPQALEREYHDLFIGITRGELLAFGSYYLTGFLNEKPLATLRSDMAAFGIARRSGERDPEDHIASILEIMAGLIDGSWTVPASLEDQKRFAQKHLFSWAPHFFRDLQGAKNAVFYASVAEVGQLFMAIERAGFEMVSDAA